jgi:hypothetical protein
MAVKDPTGGTPTLIVTEEVAVQPLAVVIEQIALYTPAAVYVCTGVAMGDAGEPSPKFQEYVAIG